MSCWWWLWLSVGFLDGSCTRWQVVCLWPLLSEDAGEVLGLSRVSNITPATISTAQAGLSFTLRADVISLGRKCNCTGEVPSLGWQMPLHNRINISQAKWSETAEAKATVLKMVVVTERCLGFFFFFVCVIKHFLLNQYSKLLISMSYISDEVMCIN